MEKGRQKMLEEGADAQIAGIHQERLAERIRTFASAAKPKKK